MQISLSDAYRSPVKSPAETTVIVGLSGGVDSSVAAYLLKAEGYQVEALFMRNWHDDTVLKSGGCSYEDDIMMARLVAKRLDIPLREIDLSEEYRERVVDYMFAEYARGRTPNPDVLCNREIKFDSFLRAALDLGADMVATGHYCRKETLPTASGPVHRLLAGVDPNKDQSYFLCQLSQEQLSRAVFPIGDLIKDEVRRIADEQKLASASRKDSQGICFVGKVHLPVFLQQKLKPKKGRMIEIPVENSAGGFSPENGLVVGEHNGAHYYTVGQRRGLNAGGGSEPRYVLAVNTDENIVYIGTGDHPLLYRDSLFIPAPEIHWIRPDLQPAAGSERHYLVRIRYRQELQKARLFFAANGITINFDHHQRAVTPGQFAAWYDGEELIGSGVIS
jgi:tRNA-uridine 2-sulfurtransferase